MIYCLQQLLNQSTAMVYCLVAQSKYSYNILLSCSIKVQLCYFAQLLNQNTARMYCTAQLFNQSMYSYYIQFCLQLLNQSTQSCVTLLLYFDMATEQYIIQQLYFEQLSSITQLYFDSATEHYINVRTTKQYSMYQLHFD